MKKLGIKIGKHALGIAIIAAVVIGVIASAVAVHSAFTSSASVKIAMNRVTDNGTTHDMTIVWPTGVEQNVSYSEKITPMTRTYTGPTNLHHSIIDFISFNPLDSANKALERISPATFVEGDRPAIHLDENGVGASKADGAQTKGESGSNPVMGEFLGWGVIGIIGLIGLFVIAGVFKWLWAEWKKVAPVIVGAAETAIGVPPVKP